ncbi:hypothetical protein HaLaN_07936 [Haematococcus lacustris]|uniref:Uncharacterized protein n=1 Tax=Haematococcus lacustris TaxID=44745 RepID=A0A699Z9S7_HAELA|nr:hypothetical protein HaLaN_07936 [Haematococcus lacustris]
MSATPWVADHSLVSAATSKYPILGLASAQASHSIAQAVITLKPLAFVGSNRWPITDSLLLERVPAASNESAPAVLLLAGAPYFVVPGLLLKEDDLSSGTGHPSPYFVVPGLLLNENVPSHLP